MKMGTLLSIKKDYKCVQAEYFVKLSGTRGYLVAVARSTLLFGVYLAATGSMSRSFFFSRGNGLACPCVAVTGHNFPGGVTAASLD